MSLEQSQGIQGPESNCQGVWTRRFVWLLLMTAGVRLAFLLLSPLELSPDEAYYWDWSRNLAWGYYSKPPMVAWLIGAATSILPVSEVGVRFPAVLLNVLALAGIFLCGRKMADDKAGFIAALTYVATIGSAVAGYIMTIDAPLLCFWVWTLYFFSSGIDEARKGSKQAWLWWLFAGVMCGLGLLSKQTMVALTFASALFLFSLRDTRGFLKQKGPYLFFLVQFIMVVPFLLWNYRNGWITFLHTAHHFEGAEKARHLRIGTFFELLGSQIGIITPLIFFLVFCAAIASLAVIARNLKRSPQSVAWPLLGPIYLEISGFFPLAAVFLLSFTQRVNANWPAPFYLSLCILLGIWLHAQWAQSRWQDRCRALFPRAILLGLFLVILTYSVPFIFVYTPLEGKPFDPTVRLRGWRQLGIEAQELFESLPRPNMSFVVARRRQTASELAFYMKDRPRVYRWNGFARKIKSQYELWPGPIDKLGWDALVIIDVEKDIKGLDRCFSSFTFLKRIKVPLGNGRFRVFNAYLGRRLEKWAPT
ncbi:MAG: phospholipid carrier-dependent glycosyltransferase [Thermodesulfobacteria bacterium]|nr:phospholipid carrier-dependent glycosyltransferase [Thermodesulfobacteriota bacterium]